MPELQRIRCAEITVRPILRSGLAKRLCMRRILSFQRISLPAGKYVKAIGSQSRHYNKGCRDAGSMSQSVPTIQSEIMHPADAPKGRAADATVRLLITLLILLITLLSILITLATLLIPLITILIPFATTWIPLETILIPLVTSLPPLGTPLISLVTTLILLVVILITYLVTSIILLHIFDITRNLQDHTQSIYDHSYDTDDHFCNISDHTHAIFEPSCIICELTRPLHEHSHDAW